SAVEGLELIARTTPIDGPLAETKRYLYGIDDEGRVAVFDFVADPAGGLPTLTPLLVPVPDVRFTRYADRIELPLPAQALEVIDTTSQSDYVCGEEAVDDLRIERTRLRALAQPLSAADARKLARVEARISIYENAAADYLRGVFVAVASTAGQLALIDVHDLDSSCRAQQFCCASNGGTTGINGVPTSCLSDDPARNLAALNQPRSTDAQESLLVRRHAWRRRNAGPQTAELGTSSLLATQECDATDAHASVNTNGLGRLCTPADGYTQLNETWRVDYQAQLPGSANGYAHWEPVAGNDRQLTLVAPSELNLCARGVEERSENPGEENVGDLVAVLGRPPEGRRGSRCPDPSADAAPLFRIVEAFADHLVVEPYFPPETPGDPVQRVADALYCYPDYVGVELRAGGFLVLGNAGTYLHRITTGMGGACIVDTTLDPLLDSRVRRRTITQSGAPVAADVFRNPYVSFALAPVADGVSQETRETTISVSRASAPFLVSTVNPGDSVTTALPSALQYYPEAGYLFLLDTAGQGLRLYTMAPFERQTNPIR
ncbi:MAG TPA: hypothetical protein VFX59_03555, partial [Polyangiales bacterium]|nr:hypothetical protein [Polyangiales bacterium]